MILITASRAASILGINKRTLFRWEKSGRLKSRREGILGTRVYDKEYVEVAKKILDLNKVEEEHVKKLPRIRKDIEKNCLIQEYVPGKPLKFLSEKEIEDAMKAFDAEEAWLKKHEQILRKLYSYPMGIVRDLLVEN